MTTDTEAAAPSLAEQLRKGLDALPPRTQANIASLVKNYPNGVSEFSLEMLCEDAIVEDRYLRSADLRAVNADLLTALENIRDSLTVYPENKSKKQLVNYVYQVHNLAVSALAGLGVK